MDKRIYVVKKEDGSFVKLSVRTPNSEETEIADIEYSKSFVKALKNNIPTAKAMEKILAESGTWTKDDDKKLEDIIEEGAKLEDVLSDEKTSDAEKIEIEKRLNDLRDMSSELRREKNSYYNHTAESKAADAQRDCTVVLVTRFADSDLPVWKSLDDFLKEQDGNLIYRAVYEYLALLNGVEGLPDDTKEEVKEEKPAVVEAEKA